MANGKRAEPENYLASAEMSVESNYNSIDGIINNEGSKPSVLEALRQHQEQKYERRKEMERTQTEQTRERPSREAR